MSKQPLTINAKSIRTELESYKNKDLQCLTEYIWNALDAQATEININFKIPEENIGFINSIDIIDNGKGWNFNENTNTFLSSNKSDKSSQNITLPHGKYGRGRYAFIWIANSMEVLSGNQKLSLTKTTDLNIETLENSFKGTKITLNDITSNFSDKIIDKENLELNLIKEFGWFLYGNKNIALKINEEKIDYKSNIEKEENIEYPKNNDCIIDIVIWKNKPTEFSKYYFLDIQNNEIYKENTGLNKKKDNFFHSVFIRSNIFNITDFTEDKKQDEKQISLNLNQNNEIKKEIIRFAKDELEKLRKTFLKQNSNLIIKSFKEDKIIPDLNKFGIRDNEAYNNLLQSLYVLRPSFFNGKNKEDKKFLCSAIAGLLSHEDNTLILSMLSQIQELTTQEKEDLQEILNNFKLSNIIKTIKEIDHRLKIIDNLKELLFNNKKETLENDLQRILDENFWIFGEQFRLFSSTEGALKDVLQKYAKEILHTDEAIQSESKKELDLFLTKTEHINDTQVKNIIVEIKRPSIKLGKKEMQQIEDYMEAIKKEPICNGNNQIWEFYLIGNSFNESIENRIKNSANHGESKLGLIYNNTDDNVKIYVRKWSDILEAEWGYKMKYLKENLEKKAKETEKRSSQKIVEDCLN